MTTENAVNKDFVACSNCFNDEGLKIDAIQIGIEDDSKCTRCLSESGYKLTEEIILRLCYRFFVRGTIQRLDYGGAPLVQMNKQHYNQTNINVSAWLVKDVELLEEIGKMGLFYYGPRLWMVGEIEPLKALHNLETRSKIVESIIKKYPIKELTPGQRFYRIRKNPKTPNEISEYDTPPSIFLGEGRFDNSNFPIMYASQDLEVCLHECRVTVEDEIYVCTLEPRKVLKLLDLTHMLDEEGVTEFESLDLSIHFLFLAGKHSYEVCRYIAKYIHEHNFDGIIYPSYFSYLRTGAIPYETAYGVSIRKLEVFSDYAGSQIIPNLALFGYPIAEEKVAINCINRVLINQVVYNTSFGPAM